MWVIKKKGGGGWGLMFLIFCRFSLVSSFILSQSCQRFLKYGETYFNTHRDLLRFWKTIAYTMFGTVARKKRKFELPFSSIFHPKISINNVRQAVHTVAPRRPEAMQSQPVKFLPVCHRDLNPAANVRFPRDFHSF